METSQLTFERTVKSVELVGHFTTYVVMLQCTW